MTSKPPCRYRPHRDGGGDLQAGQQVGAVAECPRQHNVADEDDVWLAPPDGSCQLASGSTVHVSTRFAPAAASVGAAAGQSGSIPGAGEQPERFAGIFGSNIVIVVSPHGRNIVNSGSKQSGE